MLIMRERLQRERERERESNEKRECGKAGKLEEEKLIFVFVSILPAAVRRGRTAATCASRRLFLYPKTCERARAGVVLRLFAGQGDRKTHFNYTRKSSGRKEEKKTRPRMEPSNASEQEADVRRDTPVAGKSQADASEEIQWPIKRNGVAKPIRRSVRRPRQIKRLSIHRHSAVVFTDPQGIVYHIDNDYIIIYLSLSRTNLKNRQKKCVCVNRKGNRKH